MNQRDAVYNATTSVLREACINFEGKNVATLVTDEMKTKIVDIVANGITEGTVDFSSRARAKYDTEKKVRSYAMALVSDSFRKDSRLTNGEKYTPKNPGSRAKDEQLASLKQLLKIHGDDADKAVQIAKAIETRQNELKAEKAKTKTVEVNMDVVPEEIKALLK